MKMTPEKIKVSVILPSLNVVDYIKECMDSAVQQTLDEIEIISIDAGSTDGTWEVLCGYAEQSEYKERIRLLRTDIRSYGYQVNLGIREARGEYIAILETDDWVDPNMYEVLYDLAKSYNLDMIKADYDDFLITMNGMPLVRHNCIWEKRPERYQKVFHPSEIPEVWWLDRALWKGIYKKSFLMGNNIFLNESPGAAYQDIGFMQMVLSHVQRVMYTNHSFYRYRMGREGASVNSLKGLQFAYQEMSRLIDDESFYQKVENRKGFYTFMAVSFLGEYNKLIAKLNYDCDSEYIREYYPWFQQKLQLAMSNNWIQWDSLEEHVQKSLCGLLSDEKAYVDKIREADAPWNAVYHMLKGKRLYIFGAGIEGRRVVKWLLRTDIMVVDICDNNEQLWNTKVVILDIHAPADTISRFLSDPEEKLFVIANKHHADEIAQQLKAASIMSEHMIEVSRYLR